MARRSRNLSSNQKKRKQRRSKLYYKNKENQRPTKNFDDQIELPETENRPGYEKKTEQFYMNRNTIVMGKKLPPRLQLPHELPVCLLDEKCKHATVSNPYVGFLNLINLDVSKLPKIRQKAKEPTITTEKIKTKKRIRRRFPDLTDNKK